MEEESNRILGADVELVELEERIVDELLAGHDVSELLNDERWVAYKPMGYLGSIPDVVGDTWKNVETGYLVSSNKGEFNETWPSSVWVKKMNLKTKNKKDSLKFFLDIASLEKSIKCSTLIYRGVRTHSQVENSFLSGFPGSVSLENEFGNGLYATDDLDYAMTYAGKVGALMIFNWSDGARDVITKDISGQVWSETVYRWIRREPKRLVHNGCDILHGAVTANHEAIRVHGCQPIASNIFQYMGKRDRGYAAFEKRLVGVLYFDI
jgi:hypothetical protein